MARLLPADFDLTLLPHSEQRVRKAFLLGLDESWIVVPSVSIVGVPVGSASGTK